MGSMGRGGTPGSHAEGRHLRFLSLPPAVPSLADWEASEAALFVAGGLVASERGGFDLGGRAELGASTWEDVVSFREKVRHNWGPGLNALWPRK